MALKSGKYECCFFDVIMSDLPTEIWVVIMLTDPASYRALALTCRRFKVGANVAKSAMTVAVILPDRIEYRLPNGWRHRADDKPAVLDGDGSQRWYFNDRPHRDNDQPAIVLADGSRFWYIDNGRSVILPTLIRVARTNFWYSEPPELRIMYP